MFQAKTFKLCLTTLNASIIRREQHVARAVSTSMRWYSSQPRAIPICPGCGSPVTSNPAQPGYIKSALSELPDPALVAKKAAEKRIFDQAMTTMDKEVREELLPIASDDWQYIKPARIRAQSVCTRCHSIQYHSGLRGRSGEKKPDAFNIYTEIRRDPDSLVVNVIDVMDFPSSLLNLRQQIGTRPHVIHVFNRIDVVVRQPKKLPSFLPRLKAFLRDAYQSTPDEENTTILVVSAIKGWNLDVLSEAIRKRRPGSNVYFVGAANAGKSSILNALKRKEGTPDMKKEQIQRAMQRMPVTSHIAGTTLAAIPLPMWTFPSLLLSGREKGNLVDLPGVINRGLSQFVHLDRLAKALPHKLLRPKPIPVSAGSSMVLGGLVQITVESIAPEAKGTVLVTNYTPLQPHSIKQPTTSRPEHILATDPGVCQLDPPLYNRKALRSARLPEMAVAWEATVESAPTGGYNALDIVLQDIGFLSIALWKGTAKISVKTPGGQFVTTRQPLLLQPYAHN